MTTFKVHGLQVILLIFNISLSFNAFAVSREVPIFNAQNLKGDVQSPADLAKLNSFFSVVQDALPEKMKTYLPKNINFKFKNLNSTTIHWSQLSDCNTVELDKSAKFGVANWAANQIILDSSLLPIILKGRPSLPEFMCRHRTFYQMAQAVLVHELGHLYDRSGIHDRNLEAKLENCKLQRDQLKLSAHLITERTLGYECHTLLSRRRAISDDPQYLRLSHFQNEKQKNHGISPDPYEFTNPLEHFAVNLEFFLLDPEYVCRRPATAWYLSQHFGMSQSTNSSTQKKSACKQSYTIFQNEGPHFYPIQLDPDRIYQIHYFLATKGEELMSKWGHSMYRIVVCAPEHIEPITRKTIAATPLGPDCLKDTNYHLIVSFRANVDDFIVDKLKGITGKYDSNQFLLNMNDVVEEYNWGELRDLISIPLNLAKSEQEQFVKLVLQNYWEYQGRYRFFSNNCAHEALELLQGVVTNSSFQNESPQTPRGVANAFEFLYGQKGQNLLRNPEKFEALGLYYRSKKQQLLQTFQKMIPSATYEQYQSYMDPKKVEARLEAFKNKVQAVAGQTLENQLKNSYVLAGQAWAMNVLETKSFKLYLQDHNKRAQKRTDEIEQADLNQLDGLEIELKKIIKKIQKSTPVSLNRFSYGVLLPNEIEAINLEALNQSNTKTYEEYNRISEEYFRDATEFMTRYREIIQEYQEYGKKLFRQMGEAGLLVTQKLLVQGPVVSQSCSRILGSSQQAKPECLTALRSCLAKNVHQDFENLEIFSAGTLRKWVLQRR